MTCEHKWVLIAIFEESSSLQWARFLCSECGETKAIKITGNYNIEFKE